MSDTPESQESKQEEKTPAPAEKAEAATASAPTENEKPASKAATATAEKPAPTVPAAPPAPPPFTTDELQSSTARFTHKAWYLYYNNRKDMAFIREVPVRATLDARSNAGAEEIHKLLVDGGVKEISRTDKMLSFTATFEQIQKVIRHPQTFMVDTIKL
jgi:hypothetical protein